MKINEEQREFMLQVYENAMEREQALEIYRSRFEYGLGELTRIVYQRKQGLITQKEYNMARKIIEIEFLFC